MPEYRNMVLHELNNGQFVFAAIADSSIIAQLNNSADFKNYVPQKELSGKSLINGKGQIFLKLEDEVVIFENEEEFSKVIARGYYSETVSHPIMFGKDVAKDKFVQDRYILIKELLNKLDIDAKINYNKELLVKVEAAVAKKDKPYLFYRLYFSNFIALVGEVFIATNGKLKWGLEIDKDNKTWNPFLIYKDNQIALFSDLSKEVFGQFNYTNPLSEVLNSYM